MSHITLPCGHAVEVMARPGADGCLECVRAERDALRLSCADLGAELAKRDAEVQRLTGALRGVLGVVDGGSGDLDLIYDLAHAALAPAPPAATPAPGPDDMTPLPWDDEDAELAGTPAAPSSAAPAGPVTPPSVRLGGYNIASMSELDAAFMWLRGVANHYWGLRGRDGLITITVSATGGKGGGQ